MENTKKDGYKLIAGAILIAGVLVAGAILLKGQKQGNLPTNPNNPAAVNLKDIKLKPISLDEHIQGNPNAKIVIVEYSDTECPFSKRFHGTMLRIMAERGNDIMWVYRHFPIAQLHPIAFHETVATECVLSQSNNETFWKYLDEIYTKTNSNNSLDPKELTTIAKSLGLDMTKFNSCLGSEELANKVKESIASGTDAGVNGTPKSFILKNGKIVDTIDGAYPYEEVIKKLDAIK